MMHNNMICTHYYMILTLCFRISLDGQKQPHTTPIRLAPYRLPHTYRDVVARELQEVESQGIIEHSSSQWAVPIVLVPKDKTIRICVDYRHLNTVSQPDAYPMPRIDDLLDRVGQSRFIPRLGGTGKFQLIQRTAKTAFTTLFGLYQSIVMPFGLNGAPATFHRMMDHLLQGQRDYAAAFIDDIVIFSRSWEEHLCHLRQVFVTLKEAGLTVKRSKCEFATNHCEYLVHVIGNGMVRPETSKLSAVQCFPIPNTKTDVSAFLGLTGCFCPRTRESGE